MIQTPTHLVNVSRRNALKRLSQQSLAGWVALGAGSGLSVLPALAQGVNSSSKSTERLVSLGGGITEMVYAIGAESMLVGTDTTSSFPEAAQKTPKVGYLRQLSAEGLLALRPTALVASGEAGPPVVLDQLRSAGVRVELVATDHTWQEVQRKFMAVGKAARMENKAQALWQTLNAQWLEQQAKIAAAVRGRKTPKVLFILAHTGTPMVAGAGTAADAVIRFMGAQNAMASMQGYKPLTAEAMAAAAPDTILTTTQGVEAMGGAEKLWARPEMQLTPAWKRRQSAQALVARDALELIGFGPRMPALIQSLHDQIVRS